MLFHRHETRETFTALGVVIIGLEVLAALSLLFGLIGAIAMMLSPLNALPTKADIMVFIMVGFGGIAGAFIFLGMAEFLQLLLKIEFNTRKRL